MQAPKQTANEIFCGFEWKAAKQFVDLSPLAESKILARIESFDMQGKTTIYFVPVVLVKRGYTESLVRTLIAFETGAESYDEGYTFEWLNSDLPIIETVKSEMTKERGYGICFGTSDGPNYACIGF